MKIFTIAATILFCFHFQAFSQEIIIKGKINNPVTNTVELSFPTHIDTYKDVTLKLDSINNTFEYRDKLTDIAYLYLNHVSYKDSKCTECHFSDLIIEPGDEIDISFDTKDFRNSLKFEGKSAEKFRYYVEDTEATKKKDWEQIIRQHANKPIKEYFAVIDQAIQAKLTILQKYKQKVSPMFYAIREADIKAIINKNRLSVLYDTTTQDFKAIQAFPYEYQKVFFANLPSQNDTTVKAKHFLSYITSLNYTYLSEYNTLFKNSDSPNKVSFVRQNQVYFHPAFAEELSGQTILKHIVKHGITPKYQAEIAEFKALYPDGTIMQEIEELLGAKKDFIVGKPAIPFKLVDLNGKEISLKDLQGKVIYMDFWASWCGPCVRDIWSARKMKEHFKDRDDIVFLYISRDFNETDWKSAIEKYNIKGIHVLASDESPIIKDYAISSMPSYFIIGKDGNFHTIEPVSPIINEGKELIKVLEKALAANTNK